MFGVLWTSGEIVMFARFHWRVPITVRSGPSLHDDAFHARLTRRAAQSRVDRVGASICRCGGRMADDGDDLDPCRGNPAGCRKQPASPKAGGHHHEQRQISW
jgi:hypothetical protein